MAPKKPKKSKAKPKKKVTAAPAAAAPEMSPAVSGDLSKHETTEHPTSGEVRPVTG